jgi:hypothetical protein
MAAGRGVSWRVVDLVLSNSRACGIARLLLVVIAERANDDGVCWPGIPYLARRTRMHRATVFRCLPTLVDLGELLVEHRPGRSNRYTVVPAGRPVAICDPSQDATRRALRPVAPSDPSQAATQGSQVATHPSHRCDPIPLNPQEPSCTVRVPRTARRRAPKKTEATPDPRVRALIAAFVDGHQAALGTAYLVAGARDGKAFKRALTKFDEPDIRRAVPLYFQDRRSIDKLGARVPLFVDRLAVLLAGPNGRPSPARRDFTGEGQAAAAARGQA